MTIQAIPVQYKGYNFRSKTEAKWAVFFDWLGLRWDYEPQAYRFEGYSYLPDFYLADRHMYVEIKPQDMSVVEEHLQRWFIFRKCIGKPVLILAGQPWYTEFHALLVHRNNDRICSSLIPSAEMILFRGMLCFARINKREIHAIPFVRTNLAAGQLEAACRQIRQFRFTKHW